MRAGRAALTDRGRAMVAAGATLVGAGIVLGFLDLVRVGALALSLPLVSLAVARRRRLAPTAVRAPRPPAVTAGVGSAIQLTIVNSTGAPTPVLQGQERVDHALGDQARFVVGAIPAGGSRAVTYPIRPTRRGRHRAGPLTLHSSDPFGLVTTLIEVPGALDVIALPPITTLAGGAGASGAGDEGHTPTMVAAHGEDDASIRGYHEGDDLRRIHWPVTAHRGELMVRHEGRPNLRRAVLIVDTGVPRPNPDRVYPGLEWAVVALASVAAHLAQHGYALHLVTPESAAAGHAEERLALERVVLGLAVVEPDDGLGPDPDVGHVPLASLSHELITRGGVVIAAISDHDPAAVRALSASRPRSVAGLMMILDSRSFAGPAPTADEPPGVRADLPHVDLAGFLAGQDEPGGREGTGEEAVARARAEGWRATLVRRGDPVAQVWQRLTDAPAHAGASR